MSLPDAALEVIMSAHEEAVKRMPNMTEEELFSNGFLFGMRWGLMAADLPHEQAQAMMKRFMGATDA